MFATRNVIKPVKCAVCGRWLSESFMVAKIDYDGCCKQCAESHNGPGKFQTYSASWDDHTFDDLEQLGKALILYQWSMDGCADDAMGNSDYYGYFTRMGNFITCADSQGFFTFEEFDSDEAAIKAWDSYYDDGAGADENDAFISADRGPYEVSFDGKHLGTFERESRAKAAVSVEMRKTGYYPSCWFVNDHGNMRRIEVW